MLTENKIGELEKAGWEYNNPSIEKEFEFEDFEEAIEFVNEVAELAEAQEHHPDINIMYNVVRIEMYTHDANELTMKDYHLAKSIEDIRGVTFK